MIHFSDVMIDTEIIISRDKTNEIVNQFRISHNDFITIELPLEKGLYQIRIISMGKENTKSFFV